MPNGRCRLHGGKSTGPRTMEGLERSRRSRGKRHNEAHDPIGPIQRLRLRPRGTTAKAERECGPGGQSNQAAAGEHDYLLAAFILSEPRTLAHSHRRGCLSPQASPSTPEQEMELNLAWARCFCSRAQFMDLQATLAVIFVGRGRLVSWSRACTLRQP